LIRAGHSPKQAESWAGQIPVWSTAPPEAIDAFAAGIAALSRDRQQQRPSATHLGPLADAAESWNHYRSSQKPRAGHLVREAPGFAAAGGAPRGTGARTIA
jgi:hypothetical protein